MTFTDSTIEFLTSFRRELCKAMEMAKKFKPLMQPDTETDSEKRNRCECSGNADSAARFEKSLFVEFIDSFVTTNTSLPSNQSDEGNLPDSAFASLIFMTDSDK
jgi:hypothetical protein